MGLRKRGGLVLPDFLPYRLSVAANAVSRVVACAYARSHGLSTQQWRVLAVLASGGALTQQDLVARTQMDKVTVSRAARALQERGLVARRKSALDARALRLALTAAGEREFEAIAPRALAAQAQVLEGLSPRERAALKAMLKRVESAAQALLGGSAD
jgi:DNA-binding MarR family transcriptional regulator